MLTGPFAVVGAALTLSVYGAFGGVPLLVAWWPMVRAARRARRDPGDVDAVRRLATVAVVWTAVLTVALMAGTAVAADDIDTPLDVAVLIVSVGWVAGFGVTTTRVARLGGPSDRSA